MSFSFMYIELPEGVLLGQGWIYDTLHPLIDQAHDAILLYGGTWLLMAARSNWYYWLILIGLFYVGLRICLNLVVAFQGAGDRLSDGVAVYDVPGDEDDPVYVGGVQVFGETAERMREAAESEKSDDIWAEYRKDPNFWANW